MIRNKIWKSSTQNKRVAAFSSNMSDLIEAVLRRFFMKDFVKLTGFSILHNKHFPEKNTVISPNFLVCKLCGKEQFRHFLKLLFIECL